MEHIKRTERLGVIAHLLTQTPNVIHNYAEFCEMFSVAKSTVSEDIEMVADAFGKYGCGTVETISGAAGGVRYRPYVSREEANRVLEKTAGILSQPGRLLAGGFLYSSDVASDPEIVSVLGRIIAGRYYDKAPDFVLTMETKGIPLALMTAKSLGINMVVARRDTKAYEGSAVKINYVSGSAENEHIETMSLSRRAVKAGQKALIVDDFEKGGGTLQGMVEMMGECQVEVVGVEVMIATATPVQKLCNNVNALMILEGTDKMNSSCSVRPNPDYFD